MSAAATTTRKASSLIGRVMRTPLRELLGGRVAPCVDVRAMINEANLAAPLTELLNTVVQGTRLWPSEKAAVARELIAHFEDGVAAGRSPNDLTASFGDPARAARLIRRAKRRSRSLFWQVRHRVWQTLGAILVLTLTVYLVLAIRLHAGSAVLARNYWDEINAPARATPADQRAWPLYRQALMTLTGNSRRILRYHRTPDGGTPEERAAYLESNLNAVHLIRRAAELPHCGAILSPEPDEELAVTMRELGMPGGFKNEDRPRRTAPDNPPLLMLRTDSLAVLRQCARLLHLDTREAIHIGDGARLTADLDAILNIADHASETPLVIADLIAVSNVNLAVRILADVLHRQSDLLSDAQLRSLAHHLASVGGGGPFRLQIAGERAFFEDIVQRLYTDDGHGDGRPVPEFLSILNSLGMGRLNLGLYDEINVGERAIMPALAAIVADRRDLMAKYDELMAETRSNGALSLWQRGEFSVETKLVAMKASWPDRIRYLPLNLILPSLARASQILEYATQQRDAALTAVALELYRRQHGSWPTSLEALSPRFLPLVPRDRYDGHALKYRVTEDGPVLYSVGVDRDDDGGRLPPTESLPTGRKTTNKWAREWLSSAMVAEMKATGDPTLPDGDWILWPPRE